MKPCFKIYVDVAGQYRWRLLAGNGEIVASSEAYVSKQNAIRSAKNVKELSWQAEIIE
ncbi:MAG: DUF1508 domain-containing protein [Candidatus Gracilibacteria bacterium]|jgi:hypothetical protein